MLRPPIWHQEPVSWPLSDHADRRKNRVTALTFAEARERSRLLDVSGYRVELDVTGGGEAFRSATVVRFGSWPTSSRTCAVRSPYAQPCKPVSRAG
jgi:hypothetical protein